jgi:Tol biopolymer transport system component
LSRSEPGLTATLGVMHPRGQIRPTPKLVLSLAIALLCMGALSSSAKAAWPGRSGPIVYVGLDPTPDPIHTVARYLATGLRSFDPRVAGPPAQLTTDASDRDPKASADGRRIVFSRTVESTLGGSRSGIFAMDVDGSGLVQVTDGGPNGASDIEPTFYPSGRRIAFVRVGGPSDPEGRGQLYSVGIDGTGLRSLASGYAEVRTPAVSPTGRQIVFECRHFRNGLEFSWEHICSIRPDGSHRRDLTPRFKDGQPAIDPDFSPSGRMIAFSVGPGIAADVFTVRSNGARLGALTNRGPHGGRKFPRKLGYDNPAFAPSGGSIVAIARSGLRPRFVRIPLRDPAHPRTLTDLIGRSPAWAPLDAP